ERVPLSPLTQLVPEAAAIRKSCDHVRYSAIITSMSPFKQAALSWGIRLYGFQACKVKVGMEGVDDSAALKRIRRSLGKKIDLRIDANEAWHPHNLEQKLEELLPFGISSVEQPVPHDEVDGLAAIRKRIATPIMLDESLCSIGDAQRAIERGYCDSFNIRLSKCGGIINALKLAAMAYRAGLEYQLGCQVGETGILSAAGRHFATSVGKIRYLEGSYDRYLVKERLTKEDLTFHRGGRADALTGPGLGVQIDPDALKRVTISEEHWKIV
ncbi:MAG: dipeptide epimerase, partial [Planctomycetes bacterium]|nr:dipeptide epimerase [Planctomycetota bacterium]